MSQIAIRIIREEHAALSAVLQSVLTLLEKGPADDPQRFFDVLRAMLFYIDEFPEKLHHVNESNLLFPAVGRRAPELQPFIAQLETDHLQGESRVRKLQHQLLAWELLGDDARVDFTEAAHEYVRFYLNHMRLEETEILPVAQARLTEEDWSKLNASFVRDRDPLSGGERNSRYERLFSRIVLATPAPIGLGA